MIPIASTPLPLTRWIKGRLRSEKSVEIFSERIGRTLGFSSVQLVSSGNTALALILKALARQSGKRQVVVPAFSHGSLAVLLQVLGLEPVLVEADPETFVQSHQRLKEVCTAETLCVIVSHTFGLPAYTAEDVKTFAGLPCPVIEDCSQSLGSRWNRQPLGHVGRVAWASFGRGENFSTYTGGAILTNDAGLAESIREEVHALASLDAAKEVQLWWLLAAARVATFPVVYGWVWRATRKAQVPRVAEGYSQEQYGKLQAGVGAAMWDRFELWSARRRDLTQRLAAGLSAVKGVGLPRIAEASEPALNRFPIVIRHRGLRDPVQKALWKAGFEAAKHYAEPLHRVFPMGYASDKDPFPQATYLTERVLTLPVHPVVTAGHVTRMVEVIRTICG